jgi:hypothetical protein
MRPIYLKKSVVGKAESEPSVEERVVAEMAEHAESVEIDV